MSSPSPSGGAPLTDKRQLVEYLAAGGKPRAAWRIGTEHEKFVFRLKDRKPVPYDGPDGIRALLQGLSRFGWQPVLDAGNLIGLSNDKGGAISLEPGGQFELSGAPVESLHQTCGEVHEHLRQVLTVAGELGLGLLAMGFHPTARREDVPWMPKGRYAVMRRYMPKKGKLGLDMMLRTCTVQVNLDFESEADMVRKFRTGLALQPVAAALFANSPFVEGKPNGYLSYRSHVWTDVDPDRTGMLPFVFEENDHLTTAFPEVRLKRYLEMRGADSGPWRRLCALPALWVGLLYDAAALDAASGLVADWTQAEREFLRTEVPKRGLKTPFRGGTLQDVAVAVVEFARDGLRRRAKRDGGGQDESHFLETLAEIAASGRTPAEDLLTRYETRWQRRIEPVFKEEAY